MAKGEDIAERLINFAALCIDIAKAYQKILREIIFQVNW
jgi:hypothetical protein